jgi:hypothetical protein
MEAARRQLRMAINLWVDDGDPVVIHALAYAAYAVLHDLGRKRDPKWRDLLFDADMIKADRRKEWNQLIRKEANFFKHADRDGDSVIEFNPELSEFFILCAIIALEVCGESKDELESTFLLWLPLHKPDILSEEGRWHFAKADPALKVFDLKSATKREFFETIRRIIAEARRLNLTFWEKEKPGATATAKIVVTRITAKDEAPRQ